jgi:type VI secretion system protein ImpH
MQSAQCRHSAGIDSIGVHRYAMFRLAGLLPGREWRNSLSLAFPASDIAALDGSAITPACIGLLGMAGALPYHYTEAVASPGNPAARAFMDLLAAPAVDIFCAAWRESRPEFTPLPAIPMQRGQLRARTLGELFALSLGVPVRVEQFTGRWEVLPPPQCSALGSGNAGCGGGALLGERLWRLDGALRIHVGPLDRHAAQAFLPGGRAANALAALWRAAAGAASSGLQAEARIHLLPGALGAARLDGGLRLGYDSLLSERPCGERDDLRYRLC